MCFKFYLETLPVLRNSYTELLQMFTSEDVPADNSIVFWFPK